MTVGSALGTVAEESYTWLCNIPWFGKLNHFFYSQVAFRMLEKKAPALEKEGTFLLDINSESLIRFYSENSGLTDIIPTKYRYLSYCL